MYHFFTPIYIFKVQLASIDLLIVLVSELILVVKDNGKAYATYINDLFLRCKVQKVVLHSLIASVHDMQQRSSSSHVFTIPEFTIFFFTKFYLFCFSMELKFSIDIKTNEKCQYFITKDTLQPLKKETMKNS